MIKQPLVSVIIPSLNRGRYIAETIDSILGQDYPNVECIVIDGVSGDNTVEILHKYDGRIGWVQKPDKGHADAINKGWLMAKGEILTWLNADDCYAAPGAVSKAVKYFQNDHDVDVIYGDYAVISEKGEVISGILKPRGWSLESAVKYCFCTITQPASFMRRPILEKVNWLDAELGNNIDIDLWLRIGLVGKIKYVPDFFAYKRDCTGKTEDRNMSVATVNVMEKFFQNKNIPAYFKTKKFKNRAMSNAYLVGSNFALLKPYYKEFISYLVRSIAVDPLNLPRIAAKTLRTVFSVAFPKKLKTAIKKAMVKKKTLL